MLRYSVNRIASGLATLFVFMTVLFFVVNLAVDGDWTSQFILTADERIALQGDLGIGRPLWQQYWDWLAGVVTLDFGVSLSGNDVWMSIWEALAPTALVLTIGLAVSFAVGRWLGRTTAWRRRSVRTGLVTFVAVVCLTAFPPALAFFFERGTRNLIGSGELADVQRLDADLWGAGHHSPAGAQWQMMVVILVALVTAFIVGRVWGIRRPGRGAAMAAVAIGFPLAVWTVLGQGPRVLDLLAQVSLITIGLIVLTFGEVVLITRAAMEDVRTDGFIMSGRAIGLTPAQVRRRAARVTVLPVLSRLVVAIPAFLTGLVILEGVFHVGGIGTLIFDALRLQDSPMVAGGLLIVGLLTIGLRIIMDVAHVALDPRLSRSTGAQDA